VGKRWSQQAQLIGTGAFNVAEQGASVSLSGDGNTAIVGGPDDNSGVGAVWLYTHEHRGWSQRAKLVGTGAIGAARQGISGSLSDDGSTAIVGGPEDNANVGAGWVYAQPLFAGTPGKANCYDQSVSALAAQFGGLARAPSALGYSSVSALQNAVLAFCGG
jgi:hypothetical protein